MGLSGMLGELFACVIHCESPPLDHTATEVLLLPYLVMHAHVPLSEFNLLPGSLAASSRTSSQMVVLMLIDRLLTRVEDVALDIEIVFAGCSNHDLWVVQGRQFDA